MPCDGGGEQGAAAQLRFEFAHPARFDRASLIVTASNAAAVAWIDRWPDWPSAGLVLTGPSGSGKSHLAAVWRARVGASAIDGKDLGPERVPDLLASGAHVVIEAADAAPEQPLLHLLNGLAEARRYFLLIAAEAPARWPVALPDLASRLRALPVAAIAAPDDALLRAVFDKGFADRQLDVPEEVAAFLVARLERSFTTAARAIDALDRMALDGQRPINLSLARELARNWGA